MRNKILDLYISHKNNWFQILKSKKHKELYEDYYKAYIHYHEFIDDLPNKVKIYCLQNDIRGLTKKCVKGNIIKTQHIKFVVIVNVVVICTIEMKKKERIVLKKLLKKVDGGQKIHLL
jgi:hypothetical protein